MLTDVLSIAKKERGSRVTHKSNKSGSPNPGLDATNTQEVAGMKSPSCQCEVSSIFQVQRAIHRKKMSHTSGKARSLA